MTTKVCKNSVILRDMLNLPSNFAWDDLNSIEKTALMEFAHEAYALLKLSKADIRFEDWLNELKEGVHEALTQQLLGKNK